MTTATAAETAQGTASEGAEETAARARKARVHPSAEIDPSAVVGPNARVGAGRGRSPGPGRAAAGGGSGAAGLDPRQKLAAEHGEGPLLILAGPGSGKTRVLCHRIAKLAERGADPGRILAVTFTRKAANEMRERLGRMTARAPRWTMTFHSLCTRMLRADGPAAGLPESWSIADSGASRALVKRAVEGLKLDPEDWKPAGEQSRISARKNHGKHGPAALAAEMDRARRFGGVRARLAEGSVRIHREYQRLLEAQNRLDFDDLLLKAVALLDSRAGPGWIARWDHVLVDECQDTNLVQYEIMARLCRGRKTATIVGDPDQSIYGWRGAKVGNIERYREEFSPAVVELDANYRSTPQIVQAARALMESDGAVKEAGEEGVAKRRLRSARAAGGEDERLVQVVEQIDDLDEAQWVRNVVVDRLNRGGGAAEHRVAVLYRVNSLSKAVEDALNERPKIPYSMSGGVRFYDREEVKDGVAYLRIAADPAADDAFERILNKPPRGLGKEARRKIRDADLNPMPSGFIPRLLSALAEPPAPTEERPPLLERCSLALRRGGAGLTAAQRASASNLVKIIDRARAEIAGGAPPSGVLGRILEKSGYLRHLAKSGKEEDLTRLENIDQLVQTAKSYEDRAEKGGGEPPKGVRGFLDEVTLMTDREPQDESLTPVHLMTMHAAKGLEFPTVVIIGAEDGLCPLKGRDGDDLSTGYDQRREERRLFYVGMTRAEETLCISHARRRRRFNRWRDAWPSPYVKELPQRLKREENVNQGGYERSEHEGETFDARGAEKLKTIEAALAAALKERRSREGAEQFPGPMPPTESPIEGPPPGHPAAEPPAWHFDGPPPDDRYAPREDYPADYGREPPAEEAPTLFEKRMAQAEPWPPADVRGRRREE